MGVLGAAVARNTGFGAGGGGAGAMIATTSQVCQAGTTFDITVGSGGAGGTDGGGGAGTNGSNGGNSVFGSNSASTGQFAITDTITANGGGYGGYQG